MTRTPLSSIKQSAVGRTAVALVGAVGAVALAGCSAPATAPADAGAPAASGTASYQDGTYTAEGSYRTPETIETVSVTLTISDGVVEAVEVEGDPQAPETTKYQGEFIGGIAEVAVGVPLDELQVDRVAGSSLTSGGFNEAVQTIKEQAAE